MAWVMIDCESTGVDPGSRLIELAGVLIDDEGGEYDRFCAIVNPEMSLPADITALTGITNDMLRGAQVAAQVLADFAAWLPHDAIMVAHNASFDATLLQYECELAGINYRRWRIADTIPWARKLSLPSLKLFELSQHCDWHHPTPHRALPDALVTVELWRLAKAQLGLPRMRQLAPAEPLPRRWWRASTLPPPILHLDRLIRDGGTLRFRYTDARGVISERTIRPWGYAMTQQGLRLHGFCLLRQSRRRFAAERCQFIA